MRRITLTNIKHVKSMSEETACFQATVCLDGRPAATAENSGKGGMTNVSPLYIKATQTYNHDAMRALESALADEAKANPDVCLCVLFPEWNKKVVDSSIEIAKRRVGVVG